jgi:U3 small nucleolar RNA-associated protein 4
LYRQHPELELPPLSLERAIGNEQPRYGDGGCYADPLNIPGLDCLLRKTEIKTDLKSSILISYTNQTESQGFSRLSIELLLRILQYLPSSDVRNLKLASRLFATIPLLQTFWKSRFWPGNEHSHIFEVSNDLSNAHSHRDWRTLFLDLKKLSLRQGLRNRKRIWTLLQSLSTLLCTFSDLQLSGDFSSTFFEPDTHSEVDIFWKHAGGAFGPVKNFLYYGSRTLYARILSLHFKVVGVFVSMSSLGMMTYVTGLRFVLEAGQSAKLGYIISSRETYISIAGQEDDKNSGLLGFKLAVTSKGICAIACITASERITQWVGCSDNLPKMMLVGKKSLSRLKGTFDVS